MTDFKALIEQRIAELEGIAESSRKATDIVELDQSCQGRLTRMDALQGQAMAQAVELRRVAALKRLRAALGRIERNEFGECIECGEPIAQARLKADPATILCLDCASERENPAR